MAPYLIDNFAMHYSDPLIICPLIKLCPKKYEKIDIKNLTLEIIKSKPNKTVPIPSNKTLLNIMHISDLHVDLSY